MNSSQTRLSAFILSILTLLTVAMMIVLSTPVQAQSFTVEGTGTVTWVADGDTFRLQVDEYSHYETLKSHAQTRQGEVDRDLSVGDRFWSEGSFLVRVANIDTEESVHPDASKNTEAGEKASRYAKDFLTDETVEYACFDIGYWGRPICSVWTDEWEFGTHMIEQGHAEYETGFGTHPMFHERYQKADSAR